MNGQHWQLWCAAFVLWPVAFVMSSFAAEYSDDSKEITIPLEPSSPLVESAISQTRETLAGVHLSPPTVGNNSPLFAKTEDGRGVLVGDFAKDGNNEALVELTMSDDSSPGVAFARWSNGQWDVRGLWAVDTVWRPAGWKQSEGDYLPSTPAEQPFWIEKLDGDNAAWIVMVGEVSRYGQDHFVLRFDAKGGRLDLLTSAEHKPIFLPGGWLQLYSDSGRRAIWAEWQFMRWRTDRLLPQVSWHSETPYNGVDPSFVNVKRYDAKGRAESSYRITDAETGKDNEEVMTITRGSHYFATITFIWKHSLVDEQVAGIDPDGMAKAYLFEKLTGLPRSLDPELADLPGGKPLPKLEREAFTRVKGRAEATRLLTLPSNARKR